MGRAETYTCPRPGTDKQMPEFLKTFMVGERASIRQIIKEAPQLAPTIRILRKNKNLNHKVEPYFDTNGRRDEWLTRTK